jgi:putative transposase
LQNRFPTRKTTRLKDFGYSQPYTYFITICARDKEQFFNDHDLCGEVVSCLIQEKERCDFAIYAYCLMPDHIHILLSPDKSGRTISNFVGAFKSRTTRIAWRKGVKGKVWQARFYDHVLRRDEDLQQTAEYILNNPVRKGLVAHWNEYPYAGLLDEIP